MGFVKCENFIKFKFYYYNIINNFNLNIDYCLVWSLLIFILLFGLLVRICLIIVWGLIVVILFILKVEDVCIKIGVLFFCILMVIVVLLELILEGFFKL